MYNKAIEDIHPNELLNEVKSVMIVDLYRPELNNLIGDLLPEQENGLYFNNSCRNLLPSNKNFFVFIDSRFIPLMLNEDFINDPSDIYNSDGVMLMSKKVLTNYKDKISLKPKVSSYLLDIVQSYLLSKLDSICYKTNLCPINYLYSFIDDSVMDSVESILDDELGSSISDIYEFVGNDYWNIYFKRRENETLIIEKSIDWRIYEWHKIQYEKTHTE